MLTRAVTAEWTDGEACKVMKQLQEIYWLNVAKSIAEGRFNLGSIKIGADEYPRILFCKLATLEHAYAHTKG